MQTNFKITNFITPVEKEVALDLVVCYRDCQVHTKLNLILSIVFFNYDGTYFLALHF